MASCDDCTDCVHCFYSDIAEQNICRHENHDACRPQSDGPMVHDASNGIICSDFIGDD